MRRRARAERAIARRPRTRPVTWRTVQHVERLVGRVLPMTSSTIRYRGNLSSLAPRATWHRIPRPTAPGASDERLPRYRIPQLVMLRNVGVQLGNTVERLVQAM